MFKLVQKYLDRVGIDYEVVKENTAVDFEVMSPQGKWNCLLTLHDNSGVGFYSTILHPVPDDIRTKMAIYLTLLNNSRLFGNFEIDFKTGDIRFKTYIDCESIELTERIIDRTMLINIATMQKHLPEIMEQMAVA